jgi:hypothetical protein
MWLELAAELAARAEELTGLHRCMSMLKEAEVHQGQYRLCTLYQVHPGHRLHGLLTTYRRHKELEDRSMTAKQQIRAFGAECDKMAAQHGRALGAVAGSQLAKWAGEVAGLAEHCHRPSAPTIATFLENAGQRELLGQYQAMETEVLTGGRRLAEEVKRGLEHLSLYHALTR